MHNHKAIVVSCACALALGCADNLKVPETNVTPVAVARVLDDERLMPSFPFNGESLELTLDGSQSHDADGSISKYRWLSATTPSDLEPDAGSGGETAAAGAKARGPGRWIPDGEATDWPDDVKRPSVRLRAPGKYSFALWVTDERGRISDPTTLTIEVLEGAAP